ncbi:PSD1 and planctomycete cytochrome C domain-containing protein [Anatilimnocola floriformis]|uniref:PSD1 and planctomycete cytochrome C domain-containing protein n=1 Tax=Anatilimnocola floriformis TaxID=2948575 RepID=UPI0020C411B2|nr:PSD1 and planctomycete cytochrome C domain-containing protein [Anatilimnocola floriformis]
MKSLSLYICLFLALLSPLASAQEFDAASLEFFEKQVRPILAARCYECHDSKQKEPKGGLRVDSRQSLLDGGETGPAIVPGKPKEGLFIDAINHGDTYQMPPKTKLPATEIATLTKWVEMGAPWPKEAGPAALTKAFDLARRKSEHWCWQPLKQSELPAVKNESWIKQPLDRFILAKLESAGLSPALPADKRSLVRRVYFDLVGLPPTPAEVDAFLKDESPQALEKVVDRLLESPHFGERWGRHWLDLMRYAESRGHEFDYTIPGAWQYRDYVIRAINADVPYDKFMTEHVAGDLLPQPRLNPDKKFNESILGTGFWFLGEWIHSPVDIRKDETDRFDNMVDVFSKSFLGLTVTCARCHDHKFDAISQKDYYALFGYLQSSGHRLVRFETQLEEARIARELADLDSVYRVKIGDALGDEASAGAKETARYLLAAREVIQGKPLAEVAEGSKLGQARLVAWLKIIAEAKKNPTDPLHLWAIVCDSKSVEPQQLAAIIASLTPQPTTYDGEWIANYADLPRSEWLPDGVSFGLFPALPGQLRFVNEGGNVSLEVPLYAAARRDPTWNGLAIEGENEAGRLGFPRAGRSIRTKTFTIKDGRVHYLVKGVGQVYAAVDSHTMINGPLHGGLVRETGGDSNTPPRWITHDLKPYVGHGVHLEFTPKADADLQILAVAQGDKPPPLPYPLDKSAELVRQLGDAPPKTLQELADHYQRRVREGVLALQTSAADPKDRVLVAQFANLLVNQRALFVNGETPPPTTALLSEYQVARQRRLEKMPTKSQLAQAMWEGTGVDEHLLIRGNSSLKTTGAVVPRRLLEAIEVDLAPPVTVPTSTAAPAPPAVAPTPIVGSGRLQLAEKLTNPKNPFPSRVMVNRLWHHLLGRGLAPSVDNFGVLGAQPTHPELLDHLALEFIADGWSVKRAIRRIMLSNTYQMASSGKMNDRDPLNELFHQAPIRRLEGEVIRDSLLSLSGRLNAKQFGPSVAVHLTPFMQGRGKPGSGPEDGDGRRSIYLGIRRNFLSPMMLAFDTPIPASTVGRRNVSNVPAQALILMNDKFVVDQARLWARRNLGSPKSTADKIAGLYEQAFGRPATAEEILAASDFLVSQGKEYGIAEDKVASNEQVWTDLCHVLINSKEFVFLR